MKYKNALDFPWFLSGYTYNMVRRLKTLSHVLKKI